MSTETRIIVHVGLHKTGNTFLKQQVFNRLPGVNFVDSANCLVPFGNIKKGCINLVSNEELSGDPFYTVDIIARFQYAINLRFLFPDASIIVGL